MGYHKYNIGFIKLPQQHQSTSLCKNYIKPLYFVRPSNICIRKSLDFVINAYNYILAASDIYD
jgi:hypothetical protein